MTSLALGVKMNILLFLPGLWVVLFQTRGLGGMLESTAVIASIQVRSSSLSFYLSWRAQSARGLEDKNQVRLENTNDQLALSYPFFSLSNTDLTKSYFTSAFDLSRQFLYEWTVNWRFIPENVFLSKEFSNNLLFFHVCPFLVLS